MHDHGRDRPWLGSELNQRPSNWTWHLSDQHVDELVTAAAAFTDGTRDLALLTAADFSLPTLAPLLDGLRRRLVDGLGFELLKGFPVAELSPQQSAAAFVGIGAHLGSARSQNAAGDLIGHVRDIGLDSGDPDVRIYQTNERQTFHTDSADIVGLLCLETAQSGGASLLVHAAAIHREMQNRAPDLAALLFDPIATDRRGEVPAGARPYFEIPVLSRFREQLTVMYQRQYIESAQRFDEAPRLTPETGTALDLFDEIADDPTFHLELQLEVGDMQFVHNHSLLHDRTAFVSKADSPRHLLRLWLSVKGDRQLPPCFAQRLGSTTVGDRGGIITTAD